MCAEIMKSVDVSFKGLSFDLIFVAIMLTLCQNVVFSFNCETKYFCIQANAAISLLVILFAHPSKK